MTGTVRPVFVPVSPLAPNLVLLMFALSVMFTAFMIWRSPGERRLWLGISLIGLLAGVLFYIEPMWAPSAVIKDLGLSLVEGQPLPSLYRSLLVIMLLVGMWTSVLMVRDIHLRWPTPHKVVRHSLAGALMGIGSSMALGGNDSQVLMGLPSLSVAAITTVVFMLLGIMLEQFLYHRGKLFYQKP